MLDIYYVRAGRRFTPRLGMPAMGAEGRFQLFVAQGSHRAGGRRATRGARRYGTALRVCGDRIALELAMIPDLLSVKVVAAGAAL